MSDHTALLTALSYCSGQPTWRSQFASNSGCDCVLKTTVSGRAAGGPSLPSRAYAGASRTRRCTLLGMLRRVAAGARAALRPAGQVDALDVPQAAQVRDDGADVVPVRRDRRRAALKRRRARRGDERRDEQRLLCAREVARIVHHRRPRGSSVAGDVHREHVEAAVGQIRHPAVVGVRHVERHFRGRARAVDEQHDARRSVQQRAALDALAHVELGRLSVHRRRRRTDRHVMVDAEQLGAVGHRGRSRLRRRRHPAGWRSPTPQGEAWRERSIASGDDTRIAGACRGFTGRVYNAQVSRRAAHVARPFQGRVHRA